MLRTLRLAGVLAALPCAAQAHSFGQVLTLPVPLWLYLYGSAAALLLSFLVLGMHEAPRPAAAAPAATAHERGGMLRWVGVGLMLLAVATALRGSMNPYRNFSMTWFWIVFMLGGLYASVLVGGRIAWINPWQTLLIAIDRHRSGSAAPSSLWPAVVLYVALIAFELFGHGSPRSLAFALVAYTALTAACGFAFGGRAWLASGELFARYFSVGAQLARSNRSAWPTGMAGLLFVLFMLSSTAFDGLKETVIWNSMYWQQIAPAITPWLGGNLSRAYTQLSLVQDGLNFFVLVVSPLVYLALCACALAAARRLMPPSARAAHPVRSMLRALTRSLVPIAVVYNAAHYFAILIGQGSRLPALLLDPFGWGTAAVPRLPALSPLATWHVQVALILVGHVFGIAWCHRDLWLHDASRRRNWLVQSPLLMLMLLLTASGLWIMSLPVNPSRAL
jgi:hypothetical protein